MNAKKCKAIRRSLRQQVRMIELETGEVVYPHGHAMFAPRQTGRVGKTPNTVLLQLRLSPQCFRFDYQNMKRAAKADYGY